MKSRKLWLVEAKNSGGYKLSEGDLLILASSAVRASEKATKWLNRHKYFSYKITSIQYQGEIDIF